MELDPTAFLGRFRSVTRSLDADAVSEASRFPACSGELRRVWGSGMGKFGSDGERCLRALGVTSWLSRNNRQKRHFNNPKRLAEEGRRHRFTSFLYQIHPGDQ